MWSVLYGRQVGFWRDHITFRIDALFLDPSLASARGSEGEDLDFSSETHSSFNYVYSTHLAGAGPVAVGVEDEEREPETGTDAEPGGAVLIMLIMVRLQPVLPPAFRRCCHKSDPEALLERHMAILTRKLEATKSLTSLVARREPGEGSSDDGEGSYDDGGDWGYYGAGGSNASSGLVWEGRLGLTGKIVRELSPLVYLPPPKKKQTNKQTTTLCSGSRQGGRRGRASWSSYSDDSGGSGCSYGSGGWGGGDDGDYYYSPYPDSDDGDRRAADDYADIEVGGGGGGGLTDTAASVRAMLVGASDYA